MIRIEQVRLLEERVQKVILRISELQSENTTLRNQLQSYQDRISDLEERIEGFASGQDEIEAGILSALQRLDEVEDAVVEEDLEQNQVDVIPDQEDDQSGDDSADEPYEESEPQDDEVPDDGGNDDANDANDDGDNITDEEPDEELEQYPAPDEESTEEPGKPGPELDIF